MDRREVERIAFFSWLNAEDVLEKIDACSSIVLLVAAVDERKGEKSYMEWDKR